MPPELCVSPNSHAAYVVLISNFIIDYVIKKIVTEHFFFLLLRIRQLKELFCLSSIH